MAVATASVVFVNRVMTSISCLVTSIRHLFWRGCCSHPHLFIEKTKQCEVSVGKGFGHSCLFLPYGWQVNFRSGKASK